MCFLRQDLSTATEPLLAHRSLWFLTILYERPLWTVMSGTHIRITYTFFQGRGGRKREKIFACVLEGFFGHWHDEMDDGRMERCNRWFHEVGTVEVGLHRMWRGWKQSATEAYTWYYTLQDSLPRRAYWSGARTKCKGKHPT